MEMHACCDSGGAAADGIWVNSVFSFAIYIFSYENGKKRIKEKAIWVNGKVLS